MLYFGIFATNNSPLRGDWLIPDVGFILQIMYVCLLYMENVERIERLLNCISPRRGALLVAQESPPPMPPSPRRGVLLNNKMRCKP